jgi:hypothetical protein
MRVGGIGGTPFRPFGGIRLSLGAFRQGLTALARRVPFPPNFGGVGFICRYPSPTAVQGFLKAGRKAFGDLVQKWGIRGPISQPFFPFPPTKAGTRLQLPRLADVRPRLPSLPSLRPSLPKGIMDRFNNFINKFRIKPMDVGKIWKDFQAELGRHVGGTGRRPAGDVAPFFPFPPALARTHLGAFRRGLTALARRVPFPPNFGGLRFLRGSRAKAIQNTLQAGRKAFGDLVRKRGIQPSAQRPTAPSPPLGKRAIGRPSTPAPGARKSIPEETVAKLQKSLDPRKVWDEFQKELGRYLQSPPVSDPQTGEPILLASNQSGPTSSSIWENLKYIDKLFYTLFWNAQWTTRHKVSLFRAIDKLRQQSDPQLLDTFKSIAKVVFEKYFGVPFPTLGPLLDIFQSYDTMKIANDVHAFHKALINARKLYPDLSAEQLIKQLWDPELGLGLLDPAFSAYNKTDVATIVSLYIAVTGDKNLTGKF